MKKWILLSLSILLLPLLFINKSEITLNAEIQHIDYYISSPSMISSYGDKYSILAQNDKILVFNGQNIKEIDIVSTNVVDIEQAESLYVLYTNKIIEISGNTSTTLYDIDSGAIAFTYNANTFYVAYKNSIKIYNANFTYTINDFNDIVSIDYSDNFIYVADNGQLGRQLFKLELNEDLSLITKNEGNIISRNINNAFKMVINGDTIFAMEESTIKAFNLNGDLIQNSLITPTLISSRTFKSGEIFRLIDFSINNNELLLLDNITGSVQAFKYENQELVFTKLLVSSFGADLDKLYNPKDFAFISSTEYVVCDSGNNRIMKQSTNGKFSVLYEVNNPYLITTNNSYIYIVTNNSLIVMHDNEVVKQIPLTTKFVDIVCSDNNDVYLICTNHSNLYKLNNENNTIEVVKDFSSDFIIDSSAYMQISANGKSLFIQNNNKVYKIQVSDYAIIQTYETSIYDSFAIDYSDNVFTMNNESTQTQIYCVETGNSILSANKTNLTKFNIELNTGDVYAIDNTLHKIYRIANNSSIDNLVSFKNDMSYFNSVPSMVGCKIHKVGCETQVFKYPFNINPLTTLDCNDKLIVLKEICDENSDFAYCLITNKNNKNILGYVLRSNLTEVEKEIPSFSTIKIITARANTYKYPTTLKFEDGSTCLDGEYLEHLNTATIVSYCAYITDFAGNSFYEIQLEDGSIRYINARTAMNSELDVYQRTFQPNGYVQKTRETDLIFCHNYNEQIQEYVSTGEVLADGQRIFLATELDTNNPYTKVVYLSKNNEQVTTYIETKFIYSDDLTRHKWIGLTLAIISVVLITVSLVIILKINKKNKLTAKLDNEN